MKYSKMNVLLGGIIIFNLGLATTFYFVQRHIDDQTAVYQRKVDVMQSSKGKVSSDMLKDIKPEALERYEDEINAETYAQKLYQILFTFDDSKDYNSRANKAKKLVTAGVLADRRIFGTDTDTTGNSYVEALGLKSRLYDVESYSGLTQNGAIEMISVITQEASKTDVPEGRARFVYRAKFDPRKKVFTEVSRVGMIDERLE